MKNLLKLFGIIALVTVIGFTMTTCDSGNGPDTTPTVTSFEEDSEYGGSEIFSKNAFKGCTSLSAASQQAIRDSGYIGRLYLVKVTQLTRQCLMRKVLGTHFHMISYSEPMKQKIVPDKTATLLQTEKV